MDTPTSLKELIIVHHESRMSSYQIAVIKHLLRSTVRDVIKRLQAHGSVESYRKGKCGRKRILRDRDRRAISSTIKINPRLTAREIREEVAGADATVSLDTIKRESRLQGRRAHWPKAAHFLTAPQQKV